MVESLNRGHLNGHEDVIMNDSATPGISADFSMASLEGGSTSAMRPYPDDHEPPAKQARLTDMASTAQVSVCLCLFVHVFVTVHIKSTTPPPASASPAPIPLSATATGSTVHFQIGDSTFSSTQWRF